MKTGLLLQLSVLLILLLAASSEGFFFEYPKKAFLEFVQSLKEKKEAKKKPPVNNIRHYHVHYYPAQIHVISGVSSKAPEKFDLDNLHSERLTSLGWSDYEYKYAPEPRVTISSGLHNLWDQISYPFSWGRTFQEADSKSDDSIENEGILVQLPLHNQIVIQQPSSVPKTKTSLLAAFFQKMAGTKSST